MDVDELVAVVGQGYLGLPLAVELDTQRRTIGFELTAAKVKNYRRFAAFPCEMTTKQLEIAPYLELTTGHSMLAQAGHLIVPVSNALDVAHTTGFRPLTGAGTAVGGHCISVDPAQIYKQ